MAIIRSVLVKIGADITSLQSDLNSAQKQFEQVAKTLSSTGKKMTTGLTLPIAGAGVAIAKAGMDFEQGMADIKSLGGSTEADLAAIKDQAIEMGQETKFSALDAANGVEELMKAGLSAKQVLNGGLEGSLSLAAAGEIELADAAEIASTALNAFRNDNLTVAKAADILAGAANASATDVMQLKLGLSQVSAVASGVGLSFEDTVTALADFAQNGLKGSDAGTSLKTMLLNLQPQTNKQIELFEKLNLVNSKGQSIFFDTAGKLKSMSEIAGILTKSMKGYTDAQRLAMMETMFGTDAIRAANILYKDGESGITSMKTAMSNVTAEEVAAEKMNTVKGSIENLQGALETLAIKLYDSKAGPFKSLVDSLTNIVVAFTNMDPSIQQGIMLFGLIAAVAGPIAMVIGGIASAFSAVAGVLTGAIAIISGVIEVFALWLGGAGALGECLALLPGGPIAWVIGAIVALGAIITGLWATNEGFRTGVISAWESIKATALIVFEWLKPFVLAAFEAIGDYVAKWAPLVSGIFESLFSIIGSIFTAIFEVIKYVWDQVKAYFDVWGPAYLGGFTVLFAILQGVVTTAFYLIKTVIETTLILIAGILKAVSLAMKGDWSGAWLAIKETFHSVIVNVAENIEGFKNNLINVFETLKKGVLSIWDGIVSGIMNAISPIVGAVNTVISAVKSVGSIGDLFSAPDVNISASGSGKTYKHAEGGVFTKPTLWGNHWIGERGDEALIPLDKFGDFSGGSGETIVQVILDGRIIQEYVDHGLGNTLVGLGG